MFVIKKNKIPQIYFWNQLNQFSLEFASNLPKESGATSNKMLLRTNCYKICKLRSFIIIITATMDLHAHTQTTVLKTAPKYQN